MENATNEAQLFWCSQDPDNMGWWLRYRDDRGVEDGCAIVGDEDASGEDLAAMANEFPVDVGTIRVYRGAEVCGEIVVAEGRIVRTLGW